MHSSLSRYSLSTAIHIGIMWTTFTYISCIFSPQVRFLSFTAEMCVFHSRAKCVAHRTQLPTQLKPAEMQMLLPATNKNLAPLSMTLCLQSPGTSNYSHDQWSTTPNSSFCQILFSLSRTAHKGSSCAVALQECVRSGLAILAVYQKRKWAWRGDHALSCHGNWGKSKTIGLPNPQLHEKDSETH